MKLKSRFFLIIVYLAFVMCLLPVAVFTYRHPENNFDMLGYMALVIRMDGTHDINEVHAIAYEEARGNVPAEDYRKLTEGFSFRKRFALDASEFNKLLPIYIVKPLYIWMCYLFYKTGFPLPAATVMPSIVAYLLIGLILFFWLKKYLQTAVAFLSGLLIMCSMFSVAMAARSTPDCLSAFFLFASAFFIIEKKNLLLMFLFFLLAIFTRVDNVITCFFIISFLAFIPRWKRINIYGYFLMVAILVIAYITAILPVRQFGWSIFYYAEYNRHFDFSRDFNQPVNFSYYRSLVLSKLATALVSTQFTFFMFLGLLIIGNPFSRKVKLTFDQSFVLLLISIIFFRFLLLPDLSDRFYYGFYLIFIILLVRKIFKTPSVYSANG